MWTVILSAISKILSASAKWAGIGIAFFAGGWRKEKKIAEKGIEHAKRALEIDESVETMSPADRNKWLRGGNRD